MQTLEIKVPDSKTRLVVEFLKGMGISVKVKNENNIPNGDTVAAMNELKAGKGIRFNNVKSLFGNI